MKNPCYKCTRRAEECHATCDDYKDWRKEHDAARMKARAAIEADSVIAEANTRIAEYNRKHSKRR